MDVSKLNPSVLVRRLEEVIGLDGKPRRLTESLELELGTFFGHPPTQAAELAAKFAPRVVALITAENESHEKEGTLGILVIVGSSAGLVAGSCVVYPTDSPEVANLKRNRLRVEPLLKAIKALSFAEFETFGGRVLHQLGAQMVRVTRHSGDQGIDFYGLLNLGQYQTVPTPFFRLSRDIEIRFAGQAKHYPNSAIGTAPIRELIGAISLARSDVFSEDVDLFDDLALKPFNPVVTMLFTTGDVTSGARQLAAGAGIIVRSGTQLAVFLADSGVGMIDSGTEKVFDLPTFRRWLEG